MSASWENPVTWLKWLRLCSQFSNSPETSGMLLPVFSSKLNDAESKTAAPIEQKQQAQALKQLWKCWTLHDRKQVGEGEAILVPSPIEKLQL